jgi:LacI family transcriptional regulator
VQCDGLTVVSFAHPLINAAIGQIRAAGVPVIALLSDIHEAAEEPYIGQDNHEVGRTMGWLLAHTCGARKGSVGVLLGGHRFLGHQARVEGLRSYLAERAPGLRLLEAVINLDNCDVTEEATLELIARHADLRGLCVVGGGGDGIIRALSQLPKRPSLCCILQESTELSRQALDQGLIDLVIDSQPRLLAAALVDLLVELQTTPDFDPLRHRVHIPLQIITSENARGCVRW